MTENRYFPIGKFVASHGLNGYLILDTMLHEKTKWHKIKTVFVEMRKDSFIPFFVKDIKKKTPSEIHILIEDILTKEATKPLLKKSVWITEDVFNEAAETEELVGYLNFEVWEGSKKIGAVQSVFEQPHQVLLGVDYKGNEALIPLHEKSLVKIDNKNKIIYVDLPEGLLELYE